MLCVTSVSVYKAGKDFLLDASLQIPWRGRRRRVLLGQVAFHTYRMSKLAISFRLESVLLSRNLSYAGILRSVDW